MWSPVIQLATEKHGEISIILDLIIYLDSPTSDQSTRLVLNCQRKDANVKWYHFTFQRDENTADGTEAYLYHNDRWYLTNGSSFRAKK